ncbi:MAG: hypothetical protein AAFU61_08820 [Pseudomonadota bacterium]
MAPYRTLLAAAVGLAAAAPPPAAAATAPWSALMDPQATPSAAAFARCAAASEAAEQLFGITPLIAQGEAEETPAAQAYRLAARDALSEAGSGRVQAAEQVETLVFDAYARYRAALGGVFAGAASAEALLEADLAACQTLMRRRLGS